MMTKKLLRKRLKVVRNTNSYFHIVFYVEESEPSVAAPVKKTKKSWFGLRKRKQVVVEEEPEPEPSPVG